MFSLFSLVVVKIVLPFLSGEFPERDSLLRAIMIASHACQALPCMKPFGSAAGHRHVAYRTMALALATAYALAGIDLETLVCHKKPVKEFAKDTAIETRHRAFVDKHADRTVLCHYIRKLKDCAARVHLLLCLTHVRIDIHKRQTDIRFRHDDRTSGTHLQTFGCKSRLQLFPILTAAVAAGDKEIAIM